MNATVTTETQQTISTRCRAVLNRRPISMFPNMQRSRG